VKTFKHLVSNHTLSKNLAQSHCLKYRFWQRRSFDNCRFWPLELS